jgi:hypothetical protein
MQKQRNSTNRKYDNYTTQRQYPVQLPEQTSIDDLAMMSDEELVHQANLLEHDRGVVLEARLDARPWEEEIAYVRREQQLRRSRRDAHADWQVKFASTIAASELN